jgi:hypothetical protein
MPSMITIGVGWRPDDPAYPFPREVWLMATTPNPNRPEWFPARFIEGKGWRDENDILVHDVRWWRHCGIHEEPPVA